MRTQMLFGLAVVFALTVVADAEATWPRRNWGGAYYGGPAPTPTYVSGIVIGGPMYVGDMYTPGTIVERIGPFGFVRRQVVLTAPTPGMPPSAITMTPMTTPSTGVTPAAATTPATTSTNTTGVTTSGQVLPPGTVIEQRGPFGFLRRRVIVTSPTPVVPASGTSTTPMTTPGTDVVPAGGTTTPPSKSPMPAAATTGGVITGGYVVPPDGTVMVVPARYTWRPFFRSGMMVDPSATYSTPGSVAPASYVVPQATTETYYYRPYRTGGYFGWSGFGFGWR